MSFVVELKDPNDVRADDLGTWKCTGSRQLQFTVKMTNTDCLIVSDTLSADAQVVRVRRQYHVHATDPDLHRMIAFMENNNNNNGKVMYIVSPPPCLKKTFNVLVPLIHYRFGVDYSMQLLLVSCI